MPSPPALALRLNQPAPDRPLSRVFSAFTSRKHAHSSIPQSPACIRQLSMHLHRPYLRQGCMRQPAAPRSRIVARSDRPDKSQQPEEAHARARRDATRVGGRRGGPRDPYATRGSTTSPPPCRSPPQKTRALESNSR
eukprot:366478-Chlamydomonas_euryale.AAC.7